jgi:hypothetical protein
MIWQLIPESKYMAALKSLPPATQTAQGFLFGEAASLFAGKPTYVAYLNLGACPDYRDGQAKTMLAGRDLALSRPLPVR